MARKKVNRGNIKQPRKAVNLTGGTRSRTKARAASRPKASTQRPKYDESTSLDYVRKENIIKRLNERISSIVRHAGAQNEEVMRWQAKLSRPGSPYISKDKLYDPDKIKLAKNKGYTEKVEYKLLSRSKKDIEQMDLEQLRRLEEQTKGWGQVKAEARRDLEEQARAQMELNPFAPVSEADMMPISEEDIIDYINQKQAVREFIEGNTEAFYALIEATGWDDIREHTTEEIYNQVRRLDMATYQFNQPLTQIGQEYIARRDAIRARRASLGI